MHKYFTASALAALLIGASFGVQAQQQGQQGQPAQQQQQQRTQPPQQQAAPADFSDKQLTNFANAYVEVAAIEEEFRGQLQSTEDREKAQQLQQQANEQMVEAIRGTGLSVQEYSEVATALTSNEELREEVIAMIEERE